MSKKNKQKIIILAIKEDINQIYKMKASQAGNLNKYLQGVSHRRFKETQVQPACAWCKCALSKTVPGFEECMQELKMLSKDKKTSISCSALEENIVMPQIIGEPEGVKARILAVKGKVNAIFATSRKSAQKLEAYLNLKYGGIVQHKRFAKNMIIKACAWSTINIPETITYYGTSAEVLNILEPMLQTTKEKEKDNDTILLAIKDDIKAVYTLEKMQFEKIKLYLDNFIYKEFSEAQASEACNWCGIPKPTGAFPGYERCKKRLRSNLILLAIKSGINNIFLINLSQYKDTIKYLYGFFYKTFTESNLLQACEWCKIEMPKEIPDYKQLMETLTKLKEKDKEKTSVSQSNTLKDSVEKIADILEASTRIESQPENKINKIEPISNTTYQILERNNEKEPKKHKKKKIIAIKGDVKEVVEVSKKEARKLTKQLVGVSYAIFSRKEISEAYSWLGIVETKENINYEKCKKILKSLKTKSGKSKKEKLLAIKGNIGKVVIVSKKQCKKLTKDLSGTTYMIFTKNQASEAYSWLDINIIEKIIDYKECKKILKKLNKTSEIPIVEKSVKAFPILSEIPLDKFNMKDNPPIRKYLLWYMMNGGNEFATGIFRGKVTRISEKGILLSYLSISFYILERFKENKDNNEDIILRHKLICGNEDHVWIRDYEKFLRKGVKIGDCVEFTALTYMYVRSDNSINIGLKEPQDIGLIDGYLLLVDDYLNLITATELVCENCSEKNENCKAHCTQSKLIRKANNIKVEKESNSRSSVKVCYTCGGPINDDSKTCKYCGNPLDKDFSGLLNYPAITALNSKTDDAKNINNFCMYCGAKLSTLLNFCPNCGQPLTDITKMQNISKPISPTAKNNQSQYAVQNKQEISSASDGLLAMLKPAPLDGQTKLEITSTKPSHLQIDISKTLNVPPQDF